MPSNIEIKARLADPGRTRLLAEQLAGAPPQTLHQRDTFFPCPGGRLKLREFSPSEAELIFYRRPDGPAPKQSMYSIAPVAAPGQLLEVLLAALGVGVVVTKTRLLFLVGQTRIHLDWVEGLGEYLELEVVLREGQAAAEGEQIARDLMAKLEIREDDLIDVAYADLLAAAGRTVAPQR